MHFFSERIPAANQNIPTKSLFGQMDMVDSTAAGRCEPRRMRFRQNARPIPIRSSGAGCIRASYGDEQLIPVAQGGDI